MVIAMFLAHLVGDFILQWDKLAELKARKFKGVLIHGLIVLIITWLFTLPFDPTWWQGVVFIGVAHVLIDGAQYYIRLPIRPLWRFLIDQSLHFLVIFTALAVGSFLQPNPWTNDLSAMDQFDYLLIFLLGYALLTMPTWVFLKFLTYACIDGSPPKFIDGSYKYIGIFERILITTFVVTGQFLLVPFVTLPRLFIERSRLRDQHKRRFYMFELLASVTIAVAVGLGLRWI